LCATVAVAGAGSRSTTDVPSSGAVLLGLLALVLRAPRVCKTRTRGRKRDEADPDHIT
jgi:hypothetical protein